MSLRLEIVTPERSVLSEVVDHVVLPTKTNGELDIMPGHVPLMAMSEPGELRYYQDSNAESIAIDRGFIEVVGDLVRVITEAAIEVDAIDPSVVQSAQERAQKALEEAKLSGEDPEVIEQLETKARFALAQKIISEGKSR